MTDKRPSLYRVIKDGYCDGRTALALKVRFLSLEMKTADPSVRTEIESQREFAESIRSPENMSPLQKKAYNLSYQIGTLV